MITRWHYSHQFQICTLRPRPQLLQQSPEIIKWLPSNLSYRTLLPTLPSKLGHVMMTPSPHLYSLWDIQLVLFKIIRNPEASASLTLKGNFLLSCWGDMLLRVLRRQFVRIATHPITFRYRYILGILPHSDCLLKETGVTLCKWENGYGKCNEDRLPICPNSGTSLNGYLF